MAHDVFISHSTRDKPVSDAVCAALENAGIRCWVAPRDVQPGRSFAGEITRAIQQSKAMVLIFSANSNNSSQVLREVQLAVDSQLHILQFRIEEVLLNDDLKYYLSTPHWLDAMSPPLENHLGRLAISLKTLLGKPEAEPAVSRDQPSHVATPAVKRGSASRNFWLLPLFAVGVVAAVVLAWIFLRHRVVSQSQAGPVVSATAAPARAPSSSISTTPKPFQPSWDFSAGMLPGVRTEGVELVDTGLEGKHLRFITAGRSFLETTFDVPDGVEPPTRLTVRHLAFSPNEKQAGFSPVRITLNGSELFRQGPGRTSWTEDEINLADYVQPGRNTLLWEYLDVAQEYPSIAQTPYCLKSFRLSSGDH
jgi:hypothetical protein